MVFVRTGIVLAGYVGLYLLNAVFGGYAPCYASDGQHRYDRTLLVHDCILWQPRFGTQYNEHRRNEIGLLFYPLLRLDQRFVHKTHCVSDPDFANWWKNLTDAQIHPAHRSAYRSWKAEAENSGTRSGHVTP